MSNNQEFASCVGNVSSKDFYRIIDEVRTNVEG